MLLCLVQGADSGGGFKVKGSLDHVAAVATTIDQTGVVLHFVEVRIIIPMLSSCFFFFGLQSDAAYENESRPFYEEKAQRPFLFFYFYFSHSIIHDRFIRLDCFYFNDLNEGGYHEL